ncbi:MAG: BON domain-containing protein [Deltaproteobacteria bacterium]|nr:BON domain-containing protein [Deltaproteobacteria bacterium]
MRLRIKNLFALSSIAIAMAISPVIFAQTTPPAQISGMKDSGARPGQPSDSSLAEQVKHDLQRNPITKHAHIDVQAQDRMVTLRGKVQSRKVAEKAQQLAAGVNGVRGVENYMEYPNPD